jgi:hypothetical protein
MAQELLNIQPESVKPLLDDMGRKHMRETTIARRNRKDLGKRRKNNRNVLSQGCRNPVTQGSRSMRGDQLDKSYTAQRPGSTVCHLICLRAVLNLRSIWKYASYTTRIFDHCRDPRYCSRRYVCISQGPWNGLLIRLFKSFGDDSSRICLVYKKKKART